MPPETPPPHTLDSRHIRRNFNRAAALPRPLAVLERELAARMGERLDYIRVAPQLGLDLGCGRGDELRALAARYPGSKWLGVDSAEQMLQQAAAAPGTHGITPLLRWLRSARAPAATRQRVLCADATALPLAANRFDMVWSNLTLQWVNDPLQVFRELHRVMKVGGMLLFSTLGPDTLQPLRRAFGATADAHVHRFIDMHDLGDALVKAGFADPVMDMQIITLRYSHPGLLLDDLRQSGWHNALAARPRGLGSRQHWQAMQERLAALCTDGALDVPFEIIQGHAWKPTPRTSADGRAIIHFQSPAKRPA